MPYHVNHVDVVPGAERCRTTELSLLATSSIHFHAGRCDCVWHQNNAHAQLTSYILNVFVWETCLTLRYVRRTKPRRHRCPVPSSH